MAGKSIGRRCVAIGALLAVSVNLALTAQATPPRPQDVAIRQPERILDTRTGTGAPAHQTTPGAPIRLTVPEAIAAGASAVVLNLTAVNSTEDGYVKAWPCNEAEPASSAINYLAGRTSANAAIIKLVPEGVCLTTQGPVDLVADLSGWFTGTDDFVATSPFRALDTRIAQTPLRAEVERHLKIAGVGGIGNGAASASINFTVDRPLLDGYVVAYPCGQPSNGSTVNFLKGEIVANLSVVALSGGEICMRSNVDVQIVVDTYGYSAGTGKLNVQSPSRILDTRDRDNWLYGASQSQSTIHLRVAGRGGVPNDAAAALLTVTVADSGGDGFVTVWPCDQPQPLASTLNTFKGALRSNFAIVKLPTDGTACLYFQSANLTPTNIVVDAIGWITGNVVRVEPTTPGTVVNAPQPGGGNTPGGGTIPGGGPTTSPGAPGGTIPGTPGGSPVPAGGNDSGCLFSTTGPVSFCDSFSSSSMNVASSRSGALSGTNWSVSRTGTFANVPQNQFNDWIRPTVTDCGSQIPATPPDDVRICNGRLYEAVDDGTGQTTVAMSPNQPFDIAGRTGIAVFDVNADSQGLHAAIPEFWWTDEPVPAPHGKLSGQTPYPRNGFGFSLTQLGAPCAPGTNGVDSMTVTRNYAPESVALSNISCVVSGAATGTLNHFEVRMGASHVEVWGTDAGSAELKLIGTADVTMPMTRGYIHIEDVHFDAGKFDTQRAHEFSWDNVGFDGPKLFRDLSFDAPDSLIASNSPGAVRLGYSTGSGLSIAVPGVYWLQQPTGALATYNWFATEPEVPAVRINGGAWHNTAWPFDPEMFTWRTIAVAIPLGELHQGTNFVELRSAVGAVVSNIDITLTAASPVP